MGHILSSETIYAAAFLTELGRQYLFDPMGTKRFDLDAGVDAFRIVYFSMSDPDYNYNVTSGIQFETGDIANISGKNEDCIKGAIMKTENNLIYVNLGGSKSATSAPITVPQVDVPYILATDNVTSDVNIDISKMKIDATA